MTINNLGLPFTKGSIVSTDVTLIPASLAVGANGQVLTYNSASPLGVNWASVPPNSTNVYTVSVSGSITAGTANYDSQLGLYNIFGNLVIVWVFCQFNSFDGTGDILMNLPLPVGASQLDLALGSTTYTGAYTNGDNIAIIANAGDSFATFTSFGSGATATPQSCSSSSSIRATFMYLTT